VIGTTALPTIAPHGASHVWLIPAQYGGRRVMVATRRGIRRIVREELDAQDGRSRQ